VTTREQVIATELLWAKRRAAGTRDVNQPQAAGKITSPPGRLGTSASSGAVKQQHQQHTARPTSETAATPAEDSPMAVRLPDCSTGKPCSRHCHIHHPHHSSVASDSIATPGGKDEHQHVVGKPNQATTALNQRYLSSRAPLRQEETWQPANASCRLQRPPLVECQKRQRSWWPAARQSGPGRREAPLHQTNSKASRSPQTRGQ